MNRYKGKFIKDEKVDFYHLFDILYIHKITDELIEKALKEEKE